MNRDEVTLGDDPDYNAAMLKNLVKSRTCTRQLEFTNALYFERQVPLPLKLGSRRTDVS